MGELGAAACLAGAALAMTLLAHRAPAVVAAVEEVDALVEAHVEGGVSE